MSRGARQARSGNVTEKPSRMAGAESPRAGFGWAGKKFPEALPEASGVPGLGIDLARMAQVLFEDALEAPCHLTVIRDQADLVVERQRPIVQVGAAHHGPLAVDGHRLGVQQAGLVFVDLHTGIQETTESRTAGRLDDLMVDVSRQQQHDPHSACPRVEQRVGDSRVGHEVWIGEIDHPLRGGDREEVHQVHGKAAPLRRAADDLRQHVTATILTWKIACSTQGTPGRLEPVLGECRLQVGHRVTLDPDVRLAPVALLAPIAHPLRAGAGAAGEPDQPVDDENAAMIPIVDVEDRRQIHRPVDRELATGPLEGLPRLHRHGERADPVNQHVAVDARLATFTHGLEEGLRRGAGLVHVLRIGEGLLS